MIQIRATNLEKFLTSKWKVRYWLRQWDKIFIQCTKCKEVKELTSDNFYKNKLWYLWYCSYCIDCHKRQMAKANSRTDKQYNIDYYNSNKEIIKQRVREWNKSQKWKALHYDNLDMHRHWIQQKTQKYIKQIGIRPNSCPICWYTWLIQSHHINYDEWNKIVFCCQSCHSKIHSWVITDYNVIDILQSNK